MLSVPKSPFKLNSDVQHYLWLRKGKTGSGIDDGGAFGATAAAMSSVGMDQEQIDDIFRLLSGLLALGNVEQAKMKRMSHARH